MREEEWLTCTEPYQMLRCLEAARHFSRRKARLLAVASCRRIWSLMSDKRSQLALEVAEKHADGETSLDELRSVRKAIWVDSYLKASKSAGHFAAFATRHAAGSQDPHMISSSLSTVIQAALFEFKADSPERDTAGKAEKAFQANLIRDVYGNVSFRPLVNLSEEIVSWRGNLIGGMAQTAYQDRTLPTGELKKLNLLVLADALEEAGCSVESMLQHFREPGVHVRGCWVLDALLGKK